MRVGDVVRLRSGGPEMTVECVRGAGLVDCVWFDEGRKMTAHFFVQTLETVSRARPEAREKPDRDSDRDEGQARVLRKPRKGVH